MHKPKTIGTVVRIVLVKIVFVSQNRFILLLKCFVLCTCSLLVHAPAVVRGLGLGHHIQNMILERTTPHTPHVLLKLRVLTIRNGGVVSTLN